MAVVDWPAKYVILIKSPKSSPKYAPVISTFEMKGALSCSTCYLIPDQFNHGMICVGERAPIDLYEWRECHFS